MDEVLTHGLQYLISVSTADVVIIAKFDDQSKSFLCFIPVPSIKNALYFSSLDYVLTVIGT